jgi:hypothetical protein
VLAHAGVYPSDLRRSPTLELAYAEVTGGLGPGPDARPPNGSQPAAGQGTASAAPRPAEGPGGASVAPRPAGGG